MRKNPIVAAVVTAAFGHMAQAQQSGYQPLYPQYAQPAAYSQQPVYPQPAYAQPAYAPPPPAPQVVYEQPVYAPQPAAQSVYTPTEYASTSPAAGGSEFFFKPYIGADYDWTHLVDSVSGIEQNLNGGNVHIGARVHRYLGFEAAYYRTANGEKDNGFGAGLDTTVRFQGATLEALGYLPLDDKFELIGSLGAAFVKSHLEVATVGSGDDNKWEPRYGIGAQYWLSDSLNARAMLHYTHVNGTDGGLLVTSAGLNYQF